MKRPTFFISSTIYDFRDLRSALKFYLEEHGCKVLASEFNDFSKPLDQHSYDACLKAIHSADYFLLLIGNRVGGWYDELSKVSITQREYREAYEFSKTGKLKIINFVRSEIWQVREERRELAKYLESLDLPLSNRKAILNFPNKFAEDAEFLSNFIAEVSRNVETKQATQGKGSPPKGNWIHIFSDFHDIINVLSGQIFAFAPVEDMMAKRLLRRELQAVLAQCLVKSKSNLYSPRWAIEKFYYENPITNETKHNEYMTVQTESWDLIATFSVHLLSNKLNVVVLPQIISQPTFLEFDVMTNSYKETEVYEALLLLQDQIRRFNNSNTNEVLSVIVKHNKRDRYQGAKSIDITTLELVGLLFLLDRWSNIIDLSSSIIHHLDGNPFVMPKLHSDSPVQGMQEELEKERPTLAEINQFIKQNEI